MEFGKLDSVDDVDWTMPPDDPLATKYLRNFLDSGFSGAHQSGENQPQGAQATRKLKIYFGAPAWAHKEWVGKIYPPKTKAADYLYHFSRFFSCIELNTCHYRIPSDEQTQKWLAQVPPTFRFCPKIFQGISHERGGLRSSSLVGEWVRFLEALGENLGPSFLQLPPYFDYSYRNELFHFLKSWPQQFPLSIELRHPSWFQDRQILRALTEYLQTRDIGLVITDVAGRRDVLHSSISAPFVLLRTIGNDLHASDFTRAEAWCHRFQNWEKQGLPELYLFIHQPDDLMTPEMTDFYLQQLEKVGGWKLRLSGLLDVDSSPQGKLPI